MGEGAGAGGPLIPEPTPLDPARWERAVEIFEHALEAPAGARDALIFREAGGDPDLLAIVLRMLAADAETGDLLDQGIDAVAAAALQSEALDDPGLTPGDTVGDFRILGELGRGGMGVVYAGRDLRLGRIAALKFVPTRWGRASDEAQRLLAEAQAASALDHPNVATIYQVGETSDGRRFIAMARYEGETLRHRLGRGVLGPDAALDVATQVARGLAAAHEAGIVHCDVTPANVFLTASGLVKLFDFGIAKLAGSAQDESGARGTVPYMSPEQARGQTVDARTDVWSLGALLYHMLTGEVPFPGETSHEILHRLLGIDSPPRLVGRRGIPTPLAAAVDRALSKDPNARFADAGEMLAALEQSAVAGRIARRRLVGAGIAAAMVLLLGFSLQGWTRRETVAPIPTLHLAASASEPADSATAELVRGIVDEIGSRLSALGRVRIASAGSSARGADRAARYTLEVGVRNGPSEPQFEAALRRTGSERIVWSETRPFYADDLRGLSRDLAEGVLRALQVTVSPGERLALAAGFPSNPGAFEAFLHGNQLLKLRTPASVAQAAVLYQQAHELDPLYVAALARQAYTYSILFDWGWKQSTVPASVLLERGVELTDRALALDSASAEAWLSRGYLLVQKDPHRLTGVVDALEHAIALDPNNAEAFHQYGQTQMILGRFPEATSAYRRALDLEPDRAMSLVPLAALAELSGRRPEALRFLDSAVSSAPKVAYARAIRSLIRSQDGDQTGARLDAETALALDSNFTVPALAALARTLWRVGDTVGAVEKLAEAYEAMADASVPTPTEARMIGSTLVDMHRMEEAVDLLSRVRPRGAWLWFYFSHTEFEELRRDPRAAAILAEADARGTR